MLYFAFNSPEEKMKFESLYMKYKNLLYRYAFSILKRQTPSEDAASEAWIRIYKNLHKIDEKDCNKTVNFMVTIVKNISLTMLQKENNSNVILFDNENIDKVDDVDIENEVISNLQYNELVSLIGTLKNELQAPFVLRYTNGYANKEIAEILEITENNVAVRIIRAKKTLIKMLKERGENDVK